MNSLLVGSILKILDDFGQTTTYTHRVSGSYQPSTGDTSADTTTPYTVKAYFANYNLMDSDSLVLGQRTVCIPTVDTSGTTLPEPKADDTFDGVTGDVAGVKQVQKVYSGDLIVCYICTVNE